MNLESLNSWIGKSEVAGPVFVAAELITGGRSNLTYMLTDAAGSQYVLRRPPEGQLLASAHDVVREYQIMDALSVTGVPVARPIAVCDDSTVLGVSFFIAEFVEGNVVRDSAAAQKLSPASRHQAGLSLVDTLIRIHELDIDHVGLGRLGKRHDYAGRILKRWSIQHTQVQSPIKKIDEVHKLLEANVPLQQEVALLHGDFRLDNVIIDDSGNSRAVLDWELATLGDPIADLGLFVVYWTQPGDSVERQSLGSATMTVGFANRSELIDYYVLNSGRDVSHLPFYIALGSWKLACILEGVQDRYLAGRGGGDLSGVSDLEQTIYYLIDMAVEYLADV